MTLANKNNNTYKTKFIMKKIKLHHYPQNARHGGRNLSKIAIARSFL